MACQPPTLSAMARLACVCPSPYHHLPAQLARGGPDGQLDCLVGCRRRENKWTAALQSTR